MGDRRRILLVEGSGRGFLCHYAHALGLGLHELGHAVELVTGARDELADWPMPFAKSACLSQGWASWACLVRKAKAFRPDVVHFQWVGNPLAAAAFTAWCRRQGIGVVYTPHNLLPHRGRWRSAPLYRLLYRMVDKVVARDAHIAWGLEEVLGVGGERIAQLHGSPNLLAHPLAPSRAAPEIPARTPGEIRLLYFGHGSARKGLGNLLQALDEIDLPANLHLVIAGEGVLAGADAVRLARLTWRMKVTVADRYIDGSEVANLFISSDLMVMPYAKQCKSPLTDLAAAFRLPVLRTDRVEAARFVENVHGLTVDHRDLASLAGGLEVCLRTDAIRRFKEALDREEGVEAAIGRLAQSHARLYQGLDLRPAAEPVAAKEALGRHA